MIRLLLARSAVVAAILAGSSLWAFTLLVAEPAAATPAIAAQIPSQSASCQTCHDGAPGSPRNAFGLQLEQHLTDTMNGAVVDWPTLCALDADTDGATNGAELGDACCDWRAGDAERTAASDPSDAADTTDATCGVGPDVPDAWACAAGQYGDAHCDCGCGALDVDCPAEPSLHACDSHSCPDGRVPNPLNVASCTAVPATWTCAPAWYGAADGCDCGCGAMDLDCIVAGGGAAACETNGCAAAPDEAPLQDAPHECGPVPGGQTALGCSTGGASGPMDAALLGALLGLLTLRARHRRTARGDRP